MKTSKIVMELVAALTFAGFAGAQALTIPANWNQNPVTDGVRIVESLAGGAQAPCSPNGSTWFGAGKKDTVGVAPKVYEFDTAAIPEKPFYTQIMMQNVPLYPEQDAKEGEFQTFVKEKTGDETVNQLVLRYGLGSEFLIPLQGVADDDWFAITVKTTPGSGYDVSVWKSGATVPVGTQNVPAGVVIDDTTTLQVSGVGSFANILASYGDPDRYPLVYVTPPAPTGDQPAAEPAAVDYVVNQLYALDDFDVTASMPALTGTTKIQGETVSIDSSAAIDAAYLLNVPITVEGNTITFNYQLGLCHFEHTPEGQLEARVSLRINGAKAVNQKLNGTLVVQASNDRSTWNDLDLGTLTLGENGETATLTLPTPHSKFYRVVVQ